jgi:hypothetical protein
MNLGTSVFDDEVYKQFLKSESYRLDNPAAIQRLVDATDTRDVLAKRRQLLFGVRGPLLAQLPNGIEWRRGTMEVSELKSLRVIRNCGWDEKTADGTLQTIKYPAAFSDDERSKIEAIRQQLSGTLDRTLILISETAAGPLTILDGNNRATAMMMDSAKLCGTVPIYAGLSPRMPNCLWLATCSGMTSE